MTRSHADPHSSAAGLRLPDTTLASHAIGPRQMEPRGAPARPAVSPPEVADVRREAPQSSSHRPPSPQRYRQPRGARHSPPVHGPHPHGHLHRGHGAARPGLVPPGPSAEPGLGHVAMETRPRAALPRPLWGQRRDKQRREAPLRPARPRLCPASGWLRSAGWRPRDGGAAGGGCTQLRT